MRTGRKRLALLTGMLVSAVFLFLAFRGLQPEQFWSSLRDIDLALFAFAMLVYVIAVVVIALRWQFLLRGVKLVPLSALTQLVFIGYMGNNVYPLRAGDALRIVLLRRNYQVPLVRSTTIVIVERLFDGSVMVAFILSSLLLIDLQSPTVESIVKVTTPLFIIAILIAFLVAAHPDLLRRIVQLAQRLLPVRLGRIISGVSEDISAGLESLRSPVHLLGAVISSFVTWGIEAGVYWIVLFAFDLEMSYAVALLLVGAVNLAGLIPASPGQVGVNEFVVITILSALGVPTALATAYAVAVHIAIWLPISGAGFIVARSARDGLGRYTRSQRIGGGCTLILSLARGRPRYRSA